MSDEKPLGSYADAFGRSGPSSSDAILKQTTGSADAYEAFKAAADNSGQEVMLEFRMTNGNRKAFGYAYLVGAELNPSVGITLEFVASKVTIKGRHLEPLFLRLLAHRVSHIQQIDAIQAEDSVPQDATTVTQIQFEGTN